MAGKGWYQPERIFEPFDVLRDEELGPCPEVCGGQVTPMQKLHRISSEPVPAKCNECGTEKQVHV